MIRVQALGKRFAGRTIFEDVSLELDAGDVLAVIGASGSGKTTLLRLVAGLDMPDAGEVEIDGLTASRPGYVLEPARRRIGFVFQSPTLWPHMTVEQNVAFTVAHLPKAGAAARVATLLEELGIAGLAGRYPQQISLGQARRAAIARALAAGPRYLLMDEPVASLDPACREETLRLIQITVERSGAALLYVTHDTCEAERLGARIATLEDGRLVI